MAIRESSKQLASKLRSRPYHAAFTIAVALLVALIPLFTLQHTPPEHQHTARISTSSNFPRALILPHLHSEALSHFSFHEALVKDELLELLSGSRTDSVVVVGVSYGAEVLRFARSGRRVFAFEPMPNSVELVRTAVEATKPPLDVHLFEMAATDKMDDSESFNVTYKGKSVVVRTDRVDNHVPLSVDIAVMSVDIQGEEFHAIKGSSRLMSQVRSLWVEFKACGEHNVELLRYLDEQFVMFDFVPWGGAKETDDVRHRDAFAHDVSRPGDIEAYAKWFCDVKLDGYKWLQTDVLAVRRDLLEGEEGERLLRDIAAVHHKGCSNGKCLLRELVKQ